MHIVHVVLPHNLENGGEERLVEGYQVTLENAVNRRRHSKQINNNDNGKGKEKEK